MKKSITVLLILLSMSLLFACTKKRLEWVEKNGNKYYYDENGNKLKNCYGKIGNDTYAFDKSGALIKNSIVSFDGKLSFIDSDGKPKYYGWCSYNDNWYFAEYSILQTGWIKDQGSWYYLDDSGKMCSNQWIDNKYFVDENGRMLNNTKKTIGKNTYIFDSRGEATIAPFYYNPLWNINIYLENDLSEPINTGGIDVLEWKLYDLKLSIEPTNKGLVLYIHGIAEYYNSMGYYLGRHCEPNILCRLKMIDDKGVSSSTSGQSEGSSIGVGEKTYVTWKIGYLPLFGGNIEMDFS